MMRESCKRILHGSLGAVLVLVLLGMMPQQIHDELGGLIYFFPGAHADGVMRNDGAGNISFENPVPTDLLGSGTPTTQKFLRGDSAWEPLGSGTPTSDKFLRGDFTWATITTLEEPLPAGMIAMFDAPSCPTGWTRVTTLDDRFPRGSATAGTNGGSSGHSHTVNAHSHTVDSHTHGAGTLAGASHNHGAGTLAGASHDHAAGTLSADGHTHGDGTLAVDSHLHAAGTLAGDSHQHAVDPPNTTSSNTSNNHFHLLPGGIGANVQAGSDWNVALTGESTAGQDVSHSHDVNISSFTSSGETVGISGSTAGATAGVSGSTASAGGGVSGTTGSSTVSVSGTTASSTTGVSGSTGSTAPGTSSASPGTDTDSTLPPYRTLLFCSKD